MAARNIGFAAQFQPDDVWAPPLMACAASRVDAQQRRVQGMYVAPQPGRLTLKWDNSFSKLRSKTISYRVVVFEHARADPSPVEAGECDDLARAIQRAVDLWTELCRCVDSELGTARAKAGEISALLLANDTSTAASCAAGNAWRLEWWMRCSGARRMMQRAAPDFIAMLDARPPAGAVAEQIERDITRTLPAAHDAALPANLRTVLLRYAAHKPATGYAQGMNFLAGVPLSMGASTVEAFWLLAALTDRSMAGYHDHGLSGLLVDMEVLQGLMRTHLPALATHLRALQVDCSWFMSGMLMTMFVNNLPLRLALATWDAALALGFPRLPFGVVLALLERQESVLLHVRATPAAAACCLLAAAC